MFPLISFSISPEDSRSTSTSTSTSTSNSTSDSFSNSNSISVSVSISISVSESESNSDSDSETASETEKVYMDPNSDDYIANWVPTPEGAHFSTIADGIRAPTVPNLANYISAPDLSYGKFGFTDPGVGATALKFWFYHSSGDVTYAVYINGNNLIGGSASGSAAWHSHFLEGPFSAADLATLQADINAPTAGTKVYAAYVELNP